MQVRPVFFHHLFRRLAGSAVLLAILGCGGGNRDTGDHVGTVNQVMTVSPASATVAPGQTIQFTASIPWGGSAIWSVLPASGGTFTTGGLFTAAMVPGEYRVVAMWSGDVRYTAMARVTVLLPPPASVSSTNLVNASGAQQGSQGPLVQNAAIVGEPVAVVIVLDASGTVRVRHGFDPSTQ